MNPSLFLIIMKCHPDTVFSLLWPVGGLAFIIHCCVPFPFSVHCAARERTRWWNEECCFHWQSKATAQWSNTSLDLPQVCVPETQTTNDKRFPKVQGNSKHKCVQPGWFAATLKQPENKCSKWYFLQLFVTTTSHSSTALPPEFNLAFNGSATP